MSDSPAPTLRVMSANLWGDATDPAGLAAVLERFAPDVFGAQELTRQAATVIEQHFAHVDLDPATDALGGGIASTFPASFGVVPMVHRDGRRLTGTPPGWDTAITVVTAHLVNPIMWPWWRSVSCRRHQLAAIEDHVGRIEGPVVVGGDMNATPRWPAYWRLASMEGFDDLAPATETARPTWHWKGRGRFGLRIDHLFGRQVAVAGFDVVTIPGSDHRAVVADVVPVVDPPSV